MPSKSAETKFKENSTRHLQAERHECVYSLGEAMCHVHATGGLARDLKLHMHMRRIKLYHWKVCEFYEEITIYRKTAWMIHWVWGFACSDTPAQTTHRNTQLALAATFPFNDLFGWARHPSHCCRQCTCKTLFKDGFCGISCFIQFSRQCSQCSQCFVENFNRNGICFKEILNANINFSQTTDKFLHQRKELFAKLHATC